MTPARQTIAAATQSPALRSFEAQWRARAADPLSRVREQAMERFLRLGLPTLRDENWRYTDLRSLSAQSFVNAPRAVPSDAASSPSWSLLGDSGGATIPLINGYPILRGSEESDIKGIE